MRLKIISLSLFLSCTLSTIYGQDKQPKHRYVIVPSEIALPVIASQPESKLQFEDVRYLARIGDGRGAADFKLRNRGTKPIRSLSYAVWFSNGTGWTDSWPRQITKETVMPGELVPFSDDSDEIIPLTEELRDKLQLRGEMKVVIVLMILRVEFTDGTTYSDNSKFKALEGYFEKLGAVIDP